MGRSIVILSAVISCGIAASDAGGDSQMANEDSSGLRVTRMRCEYLVNPLGLDTPQPRLSWALESPERGQLQTAYRILVAATSEKLAAGEAGLWDSGRVEDAETAHIRYAGKPLASYMTCWWKVQVWDKDGRPSLWSAPAFWTMGILKPDEWKGQWITHVPPIQPLPEAEDDAPPSFEGAQWVWFPEGEAGQDLPKGNRYFRRAIDLPANKRVLQAGALITADDQFTLFVNGRRAGKSDMKEYSWKRSCYFDIAEFLTPGLNVLAVEAVNAAEGPAGLILRCVITLDDGTQHNCVSDDSWKTSRSRAAAWNESGFDDAAWVHAKAFGPMGIAPWNEVSAEPQRGWWPAPASPLLRTSFRVAKPLRSAFAYICGLGYHELHINGEKAGDHVLDPAFTRYDKRALYVTHDVTDLVKPGDNAVGVMLGNGWMNVEARDAWDFDQAPWRDHPKVLAQIHLLYEDGSEDFVTSDLTWKGAPGPILRDGIRNGEYYDARREMPGWDTAGFDDAAWATVTEARAPGGVLKAQAMPPMKVIEEIAPVSITEPVPGVHLFDLGQNIAGWARLRIEGPAGTKIVLRYGERITPDGRLDQDDIRAHVYTGPFQTDTYILKGGGVEVWAPRFVYHGFQYVEVTGLPAPPTQNTITGCVVHTAFDPAGSFSCSNELFNTVQRLTLWAYRGNYHGYPTDCPHREKNGWMGDAHLAGELAMYNFDNAASYTKWMNDLWDEQQESGALPGIVPTSGWGYHWGNGPAWDSAYVLIPWYLYEYHGDLGILASHYERLKRYVEYLRTRSEGLIVRFGLGDWAPADTKTPEEVTSTAYFYVDTVIVAKTAELLGFEDDARTYRQLAADIRAAFNAAFYKGNGVYANGSQTALSCALYQGLAEPDQRRLVAERLAEAVEAKQNHIDTGILGAKYLLRSLTDCGRVDLAYAVAAQTTFPSYGHWIEQGATTLWEQWDGGASRNHIMFGDISAWFFSALAGIDVDPEQVGFKHILFRPQPAGDVTWARAETETIRGRVASAWRIENGQFVLDVTIPANTTATVRVPLADTEAVKVDGAPWRDFPGIESIVVDGGAVAFRVPSGSYTFAAPYPGR